jgi:sigma-B regulation protein RsbU (phosphoserine phosphatase)
LLGSHHAQKARDLSCGDFLQASGVSVPCYEIGGDYFDLVSLDRALCLLAIADVSGKGPPAALRATMVHGIIHAAARHSKELPVLMRTANQCLRARGGDNCFVTAFLATLDSRGWLRYSNAGHNPALWIQSDGCVTELAEGALPLGLMDNVSYPEAVLQLAPRTGRSRKAAARAQDAVETSMIQHPGNWSFRDASRPHVRPSR